MRVSNSRPLVGQVEHSIRPRTNSRAAEEALDSHWTERLLGKNASDSRSIFLPSIFLPDKKDKKKDRHFCKMGHNQRSPFTTHASFSSESPPRASWQQFTTLEAVSKRQKMPVLFAFSLFAFGVHASGIQSPQVLVGSRMRGRRTSDSGRGRGSIGHGSNIVTPLEETGGQHGKRIVSSIRENPAYSHCVADSGRRDGRMFRRLIIQIVRRSQRVAPRNNRSIWISHEVSRYRLLPGQLGSHPSDANPVDGKRC